MSQQADHSSDQCERDIECPTSERENSKLRAWASLDGLDRLEVESIEQLSDADVSFLAHYGEGSIEGVCKRCAPGQPLHERLAAFGGAAPGMPEVPRSRLATIPESPVLGTNTRKTRKNVSDAV